MCITVPLSTIESVVLSAYVGGAMPDVPPQDRAGWADATQDFQEEGFVSVKGYRRTGVQAVQYGEFGAQIVWISNDDQYFPGGTGNGTTLLEALNNALDAALPPAKQYTLALRRLGVE